MPVLYVRVSEHVDTYVRDCSIKSGVPLAKVIELLLAECRRRGWKIAGLEVLSGEDDR